MAKASVLSLKPKPKDINKYRELDNEWYSLGTELEIEDDELDDLEEKYSDPHKRLLKMIGVWLKKGDKPTYIKLIKALVNLDKKDIAQSLCIDLGKHLNPKVCKNWEEECPTLCSTVQQLLYVTFYSLLVVCVKCHDLYQVVW